MGEDRRAPQPWYRTERRRAQQWDRETRTAESPALHKKVASLQKRLRTRNLLPFLSAWYVSVVQQRQENPERAAHTLADRIGSAADTLSEYRQSLGNRTARGTDGRLRDTLCALVGEETAQKLVPERADAPMLTYAGFQRTLAGACTVLLGGRIAQGEGLPMLLGVTGSTLHCIRNAKTPDYVPALSATERGLQNLSRTLETEQVLETLCGMYVEAVAQRHPKSWENLLQHNRGVSHLRDVRKHLRAKIGKRDPSAMLREVLAEIVDRETINLLMPVRHEAPHRTLRGFEQLLLTAVHGQIGSYRSTAAQLGTYTQYVINRLRGNPREYAPLPREFLPIRDFLACYSAYAVPNGRYSSTAQRLSTNLHTLRERAARGQALIGKGMDFPAYVNRTIYQPEDILSRKATIPEVRKRYLVAVGDMHYTKSAAARALGLSPHNFIVQYNRAKKRKL